MLKNLNSLKNAVSISKDDQTKLNGGVLTKSRDCAVICQTAPSGTSCYGGGHSGCPGVCLGNGNYVLY